MAKQRYMQNLRPMFVSLVAKAANRREFLTRKDECGHDVETVQVPILKSENVDGVRYITGVAYEPGTVDTQGDQMTAEEIAKAAHLYMRDYQGVDVQHTNRQEPGCWVAESAILKADTEIGGEMVPAGAWTLTMGIENPDVVAKIDNGELNGFSIGGFAQYVLKADDPEPEDEAPGWFRRFLAMIGFKAKAEEPEEPPKEEEPEPKTGSTEENEPAPKPEEGERKVKKSELTEVMNGVAEALIAKGVMEDDTPAPPNAPVAKSDPVDYAAIIKAAVAEGVAQAMKVQTPAPEAAPAVEPVAKSEDTPAPQTIGSDDLVAIVKAAVAEQVGPMQEAVNTIAKAYNVGPKNLNGTSQPVEKSAEPHYMDGFFSA